MKKVALFLAVLWLAAASARAQYRKFVFEDEICVYKAVYNPRLYTKKQLEGAYRLWFTRDFEMDIYKLRVYSVLDLKKLPTVAEIDEEYARKSAELKSLKVVNLPFWKNLKARQSKILEQDYKLMRAAVEAYRKPSVLNDVTFAAACSKRFAPPLIAGGDRLLAFYRELLEEPFVNRAANEGERIYVESSVTGADRFLNAQIEIISRRWLDCADALVERGDADDAARKNFRKLFKRVEERGCDYA
jgi:hypothetical protein